VWNLGSRASNGLPASGLQGTAGLGHLLHLMPAGPGEGKAGLLGSVLENGAVQARGGSGHEDNLSCLPPKS
jgi:hypothetical protein